MGDFRILVMGNGSTISAVARAAEACRQAGFTIVEFGEACKRAGQTGLELNDVWIDEFAQISNSAYKLNPTAPVDKRPYYRRFEKRKR